MNVQTQTNHPKDPARQHKAQSLLARLRDRQLRLAVVGKVTDSARYASRATRVRSVCCAA